MIGKGTYVFLIGTIFAVLLAVAMKNPVSFIFAMFVAVVVAFIVD